MPFITTFLYSQLFITPPPPTASFQGQTVIVTGSNTGLGFEAALHIARLGAEKLILAVRTISKGEEARRHILRSTGRDADSVEVWDLDMSRSASVKAFSTRAKSLERLDVLIANAGISPTVFELSPDGNEMSAQVNVISTFLLCFLLLPQLQETARRHNVRTHLEVISSELYQIAKRPREIRRRFTVQCDKTPGGTDQSGARCQGFFASGDYRESRSVPVRIRTTFDRPQPLPSHGSQLHYGMEYGGGQSLFSSWCMLWNG